MKCPKCGVVRLFVGSADSADDVECSWCSLKCVDCGKALHLSSKMISLVRCWGCARRAEATPASPAAPAILEAAAKHMADRAAQYDSPRGERSMARTVAAFNVITGHNLTTAEGWAFMALLKLARATAGGTVKLDTYENLAAYAALMGEAAAE